MAAHLPPRRAWAWATGLSLTAALILGMGLAATDPFSLSLVFDTRGADPPAPGLTPSVRIHTDSDMGALGHPILQGDDLLPGLVDISARGTDPAPIEPLAELAAGAFVNFESPPVKPLALTGDGATLYALNTPNNSLLVFSTTGGALQLTREIRVGLDPVAVAIQPGTSGNIVWVANFVSDDINIVNAAQGAVTRVIPVGDEPVNILFDDNGETAFVITQGPDNAQLENIPLDSVELPRGAVLAFDAQTLQLLSTLRLPCNTPRAAAYRNGDLVVAALFSGNNTAVTGEPIRVNLIPPLPQGVPPFITAVWTAQFFSQTAPIFAASEMAPWPDPEMSPNHNVPSPLVHRIVPDAGLPSDWADIVDVLSDNNGDPDPAMVALFSQEFEDFIEAAFGLTDVVLLNGEQVLQQTIDDVKDSDDHDVFVIDASDPTSLSLQNTAIIGNVGTTLPGLAVNPASGAIFVSNLEARNLIRLEPNLNGDFIDHQIVIVQDSPGPVAIARADLHAGVAGFNDAVAIDPAARAASLANPTDIVFRPDGSRAYVAAFGVGRVGVLDGSNASVLGRVDVGGGPRGLALDAARDRLYVLNRTDMTIHTLDVSTDNPGVIDKYEVFNPEPAHIRDGRQFLYSTRFSNNFGSSCALCHIDGTLDQNAWDLGNPFGDLQPGPPNLLNPNGDPLLNHPVKGPMVTQSLKGLDRHLPLHWRGDQPTFQDFNGAFENLLGGEQLTPQQMDQYNDFVMTMVYPPSFYRNRDNTFKDSRADDGLAQFIGAGIPPEQQNCANCNTCHQVAHDGAMMLDEIDGDAGFNLSAGLFAQLQLVTQLRGIDKKLPAPLYNGFGLVHDGREERLSTDNPLMTFLETFFGGMPIQTKRALIAYTTAFPSNVMPVVGWQVLVARGVSAQQNADIQTMIDQHDLSPSRCDVVAHGLVNAAQRSFVLVQADPPLFQSEVDQLHTLAEMLSWVSTTNGNSLVFMAVPPGSGRRIGIDQDVDCFSDGLDPHPQINIAGDQDGNTTVNLIDFASFALCFGDTSLDPLSDCGCRADLNNDGDVDLVDFATFALNFTG